MCRKEKITWKWLANLNSKKLAERDKYPGHQLHSKFNSKALSYAFTRTGLSANNLRGWHGIFKSILLKFQESYMDILSEVIRELLGCLIEVVNPTPEGVGSEAPSLA